MSLDLSRTVCARLCHDLSGLVSALGGTLGLVEGRGEMLDLTRRTAATLATRVQLYAAAWGGAAGSLDSAEITTLLRAAPTAGRVAFEAAELAPGSALPAGMVPLLLNAALLAGEALPQGGEVRLSGSGRKGLLVLPRGKAVVWPPRLRERLAGGTLPASAMEPRHVLVPLLLASAKAAGWAVSLEDACEAGGVLMLRPG